MVNETFTEENLNKALSKAVSSGDMDEVDRLMAIELPDVPDPAPDEEEEEAAPEGETSLEETDGGDTGEVVKAADAETSAMDGAAPDVSAAATPVQPAVPQEEDELARLKRELHILKSDAGRVPYMQRRLQELERELRTNKLSSPAAKAAPATDGSTPEAAYNALPEKVRKRIDALREIDPDMADTLQEMAEALSSENTTRINEATTTLVEAEREKEEGQFLDTQYALLTQEIPYAPQVFQSPEWKEWKSTLSPARLQMAESIYADEAKVAIGAFVYDMQAKYGGNQQQQAAPPVEQTEDGSKVKEQRDRKLAASTNSKSVAGKRTKAEDDEAALFSEFSKQIREENHLQ